MHWRTNIFGYSRTQIWECFRVLEASFETATIKILNSNSNKIQIVNFVFYFHKFNIYGCNKQIYNSNSLFIMNIVAHPFGKWIFGETILVHQWKWKICTFVQKSWKKKFWNSNMDMNKRNNYTDSGEIVIATLSYYKGNCIFVATILISSTERNTMLLNVCMYTMYKCQNMYWLFIWRPWNFNGQIVKFKHFLKD